MATESIPLVIWGIWGICIYVYNFPDLIILARAITPLRPWEPSRKKKKCVGWVTGFLLNLAVWLMCFLCCLFIFIVFSWWWTRPISSAVWRWLSCFFINWSSFLLSFLPTWQSNAKLVIGGTISLYTFYAGKLNICYYSFPPNQQELQCVKSVDCPFKVTWKGVASVNKTWSSQQ